MSPITAERRQQIKQIIDQLLREPLDDSVVDSKESGSTASETSVNAEVESSVAPVNFKDDLLFRFLHPIYISGEISPKSLQEINSLSGTALLFFANINIDNSETFALKQTLLISKKITLKDIKEIDGDDHLLLQKEPLARIMDSSKDNALEIEINAVKMARKELKEKEIAKQENNIQLYCYKQLKKALEEHLVRLEQSIFGSEKAALLKKWLLEREVFLLNNGHVKPYEHYTENSHELIQILSVKRGGDEPKSLVEIKALMDQLTEIAKSPLEQDPELPNWSLLGDVICNAFIFADETTAAEAIEVLKTLSETTQIDFVQRFHQVFDHQSDNHTAIPTDADWNALKFSILAKVKSDRHFLRKITQVLRYALAPYGKPEIQKDHATGAVHCAVKPYDRHSGNGYDAPVISITGESLTKAAIAEALTQRGLPAIWVGEKPGGCEKDGALSGRYARVYIDANRQLKSQISIVSQRTSTDEASALRDNMRKFFGAFYGSWLGGDNCAPLVLGRRSNGNEATVDDVYWESTCLEGFVSVHEAAYQHLGYSHPPKRAQGRNGGQDINHPKPGTRLLYGDNSAFQRGIKGLVKEENIDLASFARAIVPGFLVDDTKLHTGKVGLATVNGQKVFVSIGSASAGHRPFNTDDYQMEDELPGEFSDTINPFNGKGNKHGACHALAYPLSFYLDPECIDRQLSAKYWPYGEVRFDKEGKFISETKKIIAEARQHAQKKLDACLQKMLETYGEEAVLKHFCNAFKTTENGKAFQFVSIDAFKKYYLAKQEQRLQSMEIFLLDLKLGQILVRYKRDESVRNSVVIDFFKKNPNYQLQFDTLVAPKNPEDPRGGKYFLRSKVLRTLLKDSLMHQPQGNVGLGIVSAYLWQVTQRQQTVASDNTAADATDALAKSDRQPVATPVTIRMLNTILHRYQKDVANKSGAKSSRVMRALQKKVPEADDVETKQNSNTELTPEQKVAIVKEIRRHSSRLAANGASQRHCAEIVKTLYGEHDDSDDRYHALMSLSPKQLAECVEQDFTSPKPAKQNDLSRELEAIQSEGDNPPASASPVAKSTGWWPWSSSAAKLTTASPVLANDGHQPHQKA